MMRLALLALDRVRGERDALAARLEAAETARDVLIQAIEDFVAPWEPQHYPQLRAALAVTAKLPAVGGDLTPAGHVHDRTDDAVAFEATAAELFISARERG
jgi:hypothetical protein